VKINGDIHYFLFSLIGVRVILRDLFSLSKTKCMTSHIMALLTNVLYGKGGILLLLKPV